MQLRSPIESVPLEAYARGIDSRSLGSRLWPSLKFAFSTEVHTYAFSIAANVLLSFIPFAVLLLSFTRNVLHWQAGAEAIKFLVMDAFPNYKAPGNERTYQQFVFDAISGLTKSHGAQVFSLAMLAFTSTGVLLPLEVALNRIWGIARNRSFLANQVVSYALVLCCSLFALLAVWLTAVNLAVINATAVRMDWMGMANALRWLTIKLTTVPATILVFFVIYYFLPNGKVPRRPVMLAAVLAGIVTEIAKHAFMALLPWLKFQDVYGNGFARSVTIVFQAYVAGMVMLVGAYFAAYGAVRAPHALPSEAPAPPVNGAST